MKRLLVGCGLLMAVGLVGVIVASVVTYSWWKQNAPDTKAYEALQHELRDTYGEPESYQPPLDGSLDAARIAVYVSVQESIVAVRDSIGENISLFLEDVAAHEDVQNKSLFRGLGKGLSFAKKGIGVFRDGVNYLTARAEAMRDAGIGEGEYIYLHALSAYAWLDWDPVAIADADPLSDVDRDILDGVEEYVDRRRELVIDQLQHTRRELEALESPSADETAFLGTVRAALDSTHVHRDEFPFTTTMPEAWRTTLEPFRARIRATLPTTVGQILLEGSDQLIDEEGGGFSFDVKSERSAR